ncbi:hypothetical protein HKD39_15475 [Nakamurella sp. DB0629]|uniref:Uncharacterized protein n=2 Tax=Nakamurella aerolata TaxID=1656892 RepID=A0A849AJT4_9ACTN|nr:hypothetical protein [Nakamurella aerolata]
MVLIGVQRSIGGFGSPEPSDRADGRRGRDRGDVPGWVMITVMTAIVVIALLAVFKDQVLNAVRSAFDKVNKSGGDTK